jgi:hypothetical protein
MCEVLKMPGERKERWLYLRAALSSTIESADSCYNANMQDNPPVKTKFTVKQPVY